ncbi:MAG: Rpn family recombination-promoting nuclease/putative transposase [Candidatus Symbiothrix sp.]|nr:Rpn family recombination-promoting nuclease/putative transposase [Candidatus Symbiothrix sp.]
MRKLKIGKYLELRTDFAFKRVFCNEKDQTLLIDFLNGLIQTEEKITNIRFLRTERLGFTEKDRKAVYDLYCEDDKGGKRIVEMQICKQEYFMDRSLFYTTFPIREQALKGVWNYKLNPVYHIAILNFTQFEKNPDYLNYFSLMNEKTYEKVSDNLNFITIELPKFKKKLSALRSNQDYWLYFFKHLPELEAEPSELKDTVFDRLFETAQTDELIEEDMAEYVKSVTEYSDVKRAMAYHLKEGMAKGEKKGEKKGRREGRREGISFRNYEIVRNMLNLNMSINDIVNVTGLASEEILKIK